MDDESLRSLPAAGEPAMTLLRVRAGAGATRGQLTWPAGVCNCALGHGGIAPVKREGDGVTPAGRFALEIVFYRADRGPRPPGKLPAAAIEPDWGWSDDPTDPTGYNQLCRLPYGYSHERLWRTDRLYDLLIVLSHNRTPPVRGGGSAIFLHLANKNLSPTAGCVAVHRKAMVTLLGHLSPTSAIDIALD